jgi:hypothetical protein
MRLARPFDRLTDCRLCGARDQPVKSVGSGVYRKPTGLSSCVDERACRQRSAELSERCRMVSNQVVREDLDFESRLYGDEYQELVGDAPRGSESVWGFHWTSKPD